MSKLKNTFILLLIFCCGISATSYSQAKKQVFVDKPFEQEYSVRYKVEDLSIVLYSVGADRNGYIQVFSSAGLLRPRAGQFLFPGTLVKDVQYQPTSDKKVAALGIYKSQLMYVDNKAVFSNAWAGKVYSRHKMPEAKLFAGDNNFTFLVSDGQNLKLVKDSVASWEGKSADPVADLKFDAANNQFWVLGRQSVSVFSPVQKKLTLVVSNPELTSMEISGDKLILGTSNGYLEYSAKDRKQLGEIKRKLPCTEITTISDIDGKLWFGSTQGAFSLRKDGKYDYYASERWIPSDKVVKIAKGPENSVLILTDKGIGQIFTKSMTLAEKAAYYEKMTRERHLRHGFNATVSGMVDGDVTTGSVENSDNDGLWTSMYLAAETFRYAVTKSDEALQNVRESLEAMEREYTVNQLNTGFPSRSFDRAGYNKNDKPWRQSPDPEWDWKSTTSSDEAIGHIFAFGAIAELVPVPEIKNKAVMLIDTLMSHILKNNYYMIDWNGKPTTWGRWNPEYVNIRPLVVGDRKICSSNITAMLQTAYHFTKKEKYKKAVISLMKDHGYLENLMRPMKSIGMAPADADELSRELSDQWNHSDDEMYYCGYWGLYRYALNDTLKAKYKEAIIDHWEIERPEKEGLWNIMTAIAEKPEIDLNEAIWYLQEYPLDLINWTVKNSQRKDIEFIAPNFRHQTIKEVLSPKELPVTRHNANRFQLDENSRGSSENSAGDIWLLPYWIGRYLGVIVEPTAKK
ncbi:MAG TPA: hypothetical protein PKO30_10860 [Prolixibacteraceae bacterium]|nr:hypothetical protein [Prolixibacteraceae bacterium]